MVKASVDTHVHITSSVIYQLSFVYECTPSKGRDIPNLLEALGGLELLIKEGIIKFTNLSFLCV